MTFHQEPSTTSTDQLYEMISEENVEQVKELLKTVDTIDDRLFNAALRGKNSTIIDLIFSKRVATYKTLAIQLEKRKFVPYFLPVGKKSYNREVAADSEQRPVSITNEDEHQTEVD